MRDFLATNQVPCLTCQGKYRSQVPRITLVILLLAVSLYNAAPSYAADPYWLSLETGKRFFREGDYGEALERFEDARLAKKNKYAALHRELVSVLSIHEVRFYKDDLGLVEKYISREFRTAAANALEELYYKTPKSELGNSASRALGELLRLQEYPEAEYWIGEVYRAEGEYAIALTQYQKALDGKDMLENPEYERELRYKMADVHRLRREYNAMEDALAAILAEDANWNIESFARAAMVNNAAKNGLDRFLVLYRNENQASEKAHRLLGQYYYENGRYNRAVEQLLFATLVQNSVIIEKIKSMRYDYRFTTLEKLMADVSASDRITRRTLEDYIEDVAYYKTLFYLANSYYGDGKSAAARAVWRFLASNAKGEWASRAQSQLNRPVLDRVPETPTEAITSKR